RHPIHGLDNKIWHRGRIYCNYKDPVIWQSNKNLKTTCTWNLQFTFDRNKLDYFIKECCLDHNHVVINSTSTAEGLREITLMADMDQKEKDTILSLARYSLPLFKVSIFEFQSDFILSNSREERY
ncbi:MAG: hypothetical protein RLZZ262_34, partial [Bacteroidota bacterium]